MTGLLGPRPVRCGPSRTTASACASQRRTYRAPRPWPETASRPLLCTTSSARSCEPGWPRCAADNRPASISLTRGSPATDGDGPHRCRLDSCLQPVLQRKSAISPKTPPGTTHNLHLLLPLLQTYTTIRRLQKKSHRFWSFLSLLNLPESGIAGDSMELIPARMMHLIHCHSRSLEYLAKACGRLLRDVLRLRINPGTVKSCGCGHQ